MINLVGGSLDKKQTAALLDAFAELRRTWDELVGLQPDIVAASGPLTAADLTLLAAALAAHRIAADALQREIMKLELGDV
jgi:hypothetical protein